jgi:hypothetical protein
MNDIQNYYDPTKDEVNKIKLGNNNVKITLEDINKLKKIKAIKNLEIVKRKKTIQKIYGKSQEN